MKTFSKLLLTLVCSVLLMLGLRRHVSSHCEIPCGIYGDRTRIDLLYEDIGTVEKSMKQIIALPQEEPINVNQIIRWVRNKEDHANKIQHTVTQYFMTQRVKPKADGESGREKYIGQLTALHGILIHAMKAKQTTDVGHCARLRALVDEFAATYFTAEDLKHIRDAHGKHHRG